MEGNGACSFCGAAASWRHFGRLPICAACASGASPSLTEEGEAGWMSVYAVVGGRSLLAYRVGPVPANTPRQIADRAVAELAKIAAGE